MAEKYRLQQQRKNKTKHSAPEVCIVPNVIDLPLAHVPAICKKQYAKDPGGNEYGNEHDAHAHGRVDEDSAENNGIYRSAGAHGRITGIVLLLGEIKDG